MLNYSEWGPVAYTLGQLHRDRFVYAPSQWETKLQCNVTSHWLGAYINDPWLQQDINHYNKFESYTLVITTKSTVGQWVYVHDYLKRPEMKHDTIEMTKILYQINQRL